MYPTLKKGDIILVSKINYNLSEPNNDEIVILEKDNDLIVKRIKNIDLDSAFVVGDNSNNSIDSRIFGKISNCSIKGKAIINLSKFELIK